MNNEEKILSLLETLNGRMDTMHGDITAMKGDITTIFKRLDGIDERFDKFEHEQSEMASAIRRIDRSVILIENEHGRKLGALFDGYQASLDRDKAIEPRVTQLERTVEKHGLEILTLKHVK